MSRIEDLTVAGWHPEYDGDARRASRRDRMPELGSRIVGGLGVLLLSPTVLTAASRSRVGAKCGSGNTAANQDVSGKSDRIDEDPDNKGSGLKSPSPSPRSNTDVRIRIAVIASGLTAASALVYTAPGTPWADADVLAVVAQANRIQAPAAVGNVPADQGMDMDMSHEGATNYSGIIRTPGRTVLVDATPATAGVNTLAITVLDAKGAPAKVDQWSATASLPGASEVAVPLAPFGEGVASAAPDLPVAGKWTFTITIRIAGSAPTSFTHVIPIGPAS